MPYPSTTVSNGKGENVVGDMSAERKGILTRRDPLRAGKRYAYDKYMQK